MSGEEKNNCLGMGGSITNKGQVKRVCIIYLCDRIIRNQWWRGAKKYF